MCFSHTRNLHTAQNRISICRWAVWVKYNKIRYCKFCIVLRLVFYLDLRCWKVTVADISAVVSWHRPAEAREGEFLQQHPDHPKMLLTWLDKDSCTTLRSIPCLPNRDTHKFYNLVFFFWFVFFLSFSLHWSVFGPAKSFFCFVFYHGRQYELAKHEII